MAVGPASVEIEGAERAATLDELVEKVVGHVAQRVRQRGGNRMSAADNTVFLRLAGPMQSWGTSSRLQLRRTDAYPSKSGVLGLALCAMGIRRTDSQGALDPLAALRMGVRVDHEGTADWDYHTAGAKIGIRRPDGKDRGIKKTAKTGEYETLLSRRQYLFDASFLVALQGDSATIADVAGHLVNPTWPFYFGRKCCVPSEPVFAGTDTFSGLTDALASVPLAAAAWGDPARRDPDARRVAGASAGHAAAQRRAAGPRRTLVLRLQQPPEPFRCCWAGDGPGGRGVVLAGERPHTTPI